MQHHRCAVCYCPSDRTAKQISSADVRAISCRNDQGMAVDKVHFDVIGGIAWWAAVTG